MSVGDYVWIDTNDDGLQDATDVPVAGATLTLTVVRADGTIESVTDVYGNAVTPTTTDANGLYEFTDLPVLAPGEAYVVTIDPSTAPALVGYVPAKAEIDPATGSSTGSATTTVDLTSGGANDPTLGFGFVPASVTPVTPVTPVTSVPRGGSLAFTGMDLTTLWFGIGSLLGGILLVVGSRRSRRSLRL